jgi:hypothetical protein
MLCSVELTVSVFACGLFSGDYLVEAESQMQYRSLVMNDPVLRKHCAVPEVFPELSTARVLTSRLVRGNPIDSAGTLPQSVRNAVARTVLIVTIRELFEWRFIQSDPNYANFLYDHPHRTINMIDFGAARSYGKQFVDGYMELVWSAANKDKEGILKVSKELGFLTGTCLSQRGLKMLLYITALFILIFRRRNAGIHRRPRQRRTRGGRALPGESPLRLRQLAADRAPGQLRRHLHEVPPHAAAHRGLLVAPEAGRRVPAVH